jgi:hypothetical protein
VPTVDIDRDAAADAARHELAKAIYPKPSWSEQVSQWFEQLLYRLTARSAEVPGGWLTLTVLVLVGVIAVVVAVRVARRTLRTSRGGTQAMFDDDERSADGHRLLAEHAAAQGDWPAAIRHRLRAVARQLETTGVITPSPGRTATELARTAGRTRHDLADEFDTAAIAFNDVTYGDDPGDATRYRQVADLDDAVTRGPAQPANSGSGGTTPWAQVR